MLERIRNFFRGLFGGNATEQAPAPAAGAVSTPEKPQSQSEPAAAAQPTFAPGTLVLYLRRSSQGPTNTLGQLFLDDQPLAHTLEGPTSPTADAQPCLAPGDYPLSLHKTGGKHSTYLYRLGDLHQGMIKLEVPDVDLPVTIGIGYDARHLYGSIVLGQLIADSHPKRLQQGEATYRQVYPRIAKHLAKDQAAVLRIEGGAASG